jgi:manganese-dependent inorganic pyrophosphatase
MNEVLVIGHRNPDTDAIVSAIGYAEFKRRTGLPEAVAARCGETNDRIDFVLNTFGVEPPRFVADVSPKVRDVMQPHVFCVAPDSTAADALGLMDAHDIRVLPVLDSERRCRGLLSLFKLSKFLFPAANRLVDSRRVLSSLRNLARTLGGGIVVANEVDQEEDLILMIGAMQLESFANRLDSYPLKSLCVVVGDRWDIQNLAIREGVRVVIVTGGHLIEAKTIQAAENKGVGLLTSPHDTATTAALCRAAIGISHVLQEDFVSFREDALLSEVRPLATASGQQLFPVLDEPGTTIGIVSKSDFLKPVDRKLILVDHNELSQAVPGADLVEILEIIDHHRIGTIRTTQPIFFRNEPVGSTSTIVADSFFRHGVELPTAIAGLLLAGVVSDTLNLTSPTTTARDAEVLVRLEKTAGVNAREFTERMFASGSILLSRTPRQAMTADCKEYHEASATFSVAQIEEVGFDQFWKHKADLLTALEDYRRERNYLFSTLLVTDVGTQDSLLLLAGQPEFAERIDYPKLEPGVFELRSVVSRKKQLLPYLTHCLQRLRAGTK